MYEAQSKAKSLTQDVSTEHAKQFAKSQSEVACQMGEVEKSRLKKRQCGPDAKPVVLHFADQLLQNLPNR
ncbi:hypothetical protein E2P81_ATG02526 [Venturia nashicola]|uniref:Uncharacterized protein n=1 Tax=Venturia nashicola TaxID=86259 RepID=A0A4Z1PNJ4_9PEZI|nr:hypothetical protein E6O75_ATG02587 [Venturia nashicola]TLD36744.1 hypothetical protein E2P81_ATG02526 [Venturia nashicola]